LSATFILVGWIIQPTNYGYLLGREKEVKGSRTKQISFVGVMTALCISSNYLMIGLSNVKFMDLLVFISGYVMGSTSGASVGILSWLIYGTLNPYGFNLPTLLATCIGESLFGLVGGVYRIRNTNSMPSKALDRRRILLKKSFWASNIKMGVLGFLLTFSYDIFTNVVTGIVFEVPLAVYIIAGIPFTVVHEVSNFFFFFLGGNALIGAIKQITSEGGEL